MYACSISDRSTNISIQPACRRSAVAGGLVPFENDPARSTIHTGSHCLRTNAMLSPHSQIRRSQNVNSVTPLNLNAHPNRRATYGTTPPCFHSRPPSQKGQNSQRRFSTHPASSVRHPAAHSVTKNTLRDKIAADRNRRPPFSLAGCGGLSQHAAALPLEILPFVIYGDVPAQRFTGLQHRGASA